MSGYAAQPNIRGVNYMTDDQRVARLVHTLSARLGISALIHLQRIKIEAVELRDLKDTSLLTAATTQLFKGWRRSGPTRIRIRATTALEFTAKLTDPHRVASCLSAGGGRSRDGA